MATRGKIDDRTRLKLEIKRMRAELQDTVAVLEERLNVPKRYGEFKAEKKRRVREWAHKNPVPAAVAFVSVTAVVGVTVWAVARKVYDSL